MHGGMHSMDGGTSPRRVVLGGDPEAPTAGLVARFRADTEVTDAGGGAVSDWGDPVGGFDLTQGSAGSRPLIQTNQINGQPAILFDGTDDSLRRASTPNINQPYSIVAIVNLVELASDPFHPILAEAGGDFTQAIVTRVSSTPPGTGMLTAFAGGGVNGATAFAANVWHWAVWVFNGASSEVFLDGVSDGAGNAGSQNLEGINLACFEGGSSPSNINLAEVLIYDHVLDAGEISDLDAYIVARYAL